MSKVIPIEPGHGTHPRTDESLATLVLRALDPQKPLCNHVNRDAGQILFCAGEQSSRVLILLDGQVKLSVDSADGKRLIIRIAEPEEILGLASAVAQMTHEMTAETIRFCRFVSLQRDVFQDILKSNPRALAAAARELGMDYNHACRRLEMLGGTPSASARLARMLLEWCESGRQTGLGMRIHIGFSHREIGEFIGATRETVSRALGEFERRNLIQIRGSVFTITNLKLLEGCAGIQAFKSGRPA